MYAMDRLHDREAHYLAEASRVRAPRVYAYGSDNVAMWDERGLLNIIHHGCGMENGDAAAVYVVGTMSAQHVKIGRTSEPIKRLSSLQNGNPETLFFHRLFWFKNRDWASITEAEAHRRAGRSYGRMASEWFNCTPMQAHGIIEEVSRRSTDEFHMVAPLSTEMAQ